MGLYPGAFWYVSCRRAAIKYIQRRLSTKD
jgi:hypothetical protein